LVERVSPTPTGEGRLLRTPPAAGGRAGARLGRCRWAEADELLTRYHDEEWGVPVHDDRALFELLVLEGSQAGLAWSTILRKREAYRRALDDFDPGKVASYGPADVGRLLADAGIVRHRAKIEATIANARAVLDVQREHGSLDRFLWHFVKGRPIQNAWRSPREVPAETAASRGMSRTLRQRGFRFLGPTICYALMQAAGLVNDHTTNCFRWSALRRAARRRG
jgi:DNA-3-methyladenine glycosylase I